MALGIAAAAGRNEQIRLSNIMPTRCKTSALYKILKTTEWANLCPYHYETHFADQARLNLTKWGMERSYGETSEQHIKRMRQFVKTAFKGFAGKSL